LQKLWEFQRALHVISEAFAEGWKACALC
jgi:hypothetical protein